MTDDTQPAGEQEPAGGTQPAGGSQPPAPPANWQAPPAPPAPAPGPAGFVYGDIPNRIIALIIDAILLAIVGAVVGAVLNGILGPEVTIKDTDQLLNNLLSGNASSVVEVNYFRVLVGAIVNLGISAAYFVYAWTTMRASFGMRALGMQVGNFPDGKTLTQNQAIRRWAALFGPGQAGQLLGAIPALGGLVGLAGLAYTIYLLYTTYQSPTKQGFHDTFANTAVVKASRAA